MIVVLYVFNSISRMGAHGQPALRDSRIQQQSTNYKFLRTFERAFYFVLHLVTQFIYAPELVVWFLLCLMLV